MMYNKNGLIIGKIEDLNTGEISEFNHYLLSTGLRIKTIVKIINSQSFNHPDNSLQVYVDCFALDSIGSVFKLTLNFTPDNQNKLNKIAADLKQSLYLYVDGEYTISQDDYDITIHDPNYSSLPYALSENDVEEAFNRNR
jgi:hypothetical protein